MLFAYATCTVSPSNSWILHIVDYMSTMCKICLFVKKQTESVCVPSGSFTYEHFESRLGLSRHILQDNKLFQTLL